MFKRLILIILCALLALYSCSDNNSGSAETSLENILRDLRTDGMKLWWDILAVYNADENPLDYPGFDAIEAALENASNMLERASYVIITNICVAIGADEGYFEQYEPYKARLKAMLENPEGGTINDYIFGYLALKTSGDDFDEEPVREYLEAAQKADGGFAISGDEGDIDVTAFAVAALVLIGSEQPLLRATGFISENINEDGTFTGWGSANANSTASVISALMAQNYAVMSGDGEIIRLAQEGLSLFEKSGGYAYAAGMERDLLATAQGAIALGDIKNGTSVWIKLYLEMRESE